MSRIELETLSYFLHSEEGKGIVACVLNFLTTTKGRILLFLYPSLL